jgi:hypothetical protein
MPSNSNTVKSGVLSNTLHAIENGAHNLALLVDGDQIARREFKRTMMASVGKVVDKATEIKDNALNFGKKCIAAAPWVALSILPSLGMHLLADANGGKLFVPGLSTLTYVSLLVETTLISALSIGIGGVKTVDAFVDAG